MLSIADGEALSRALSSPLDARLKQLLICRRDQLATDEADEEIGDLVHFAIVQPGDAAADLELTVRFSVFQNPADGSCFGAPDFSPGWEWIQDHGFAYELCFIMDDSGFGHVVIIPEQQGIDPELLNFCRHYASEHA